MGNHDQSLRKKRSLFRVYPNNSKNLPIGQSSLSLSSSDGSLGVKSRLLSDGSLRLEELFLGPEVRQDLQVGFPNARASAFERPVLGSLEAKFVPDGIDRLNEGGSLLVCVQGRGSDAKSLRSDGDGREV